VAHKSKGSSANEDLVTTASAWQGDDALRDPADDLLGRASFAQGVAEAIASRVDVSSIVVGLFGPWGDGKTTVLNFIERSLGSETVVVRFNPWLISSEHDLLPAFFEQVASELSLKLGGTRRQVADAFRAVGRFLRPIAVSPGAGSLEPGAAAEWIGEGIAGTSLVDLRKDFERLLADAGRRIVVMIDDLDRLDDREIRTMFRLVRLAAPFEGVIYVIACDDAVVTGALSALQGSTRETGFAYLEKIIQVPLHIPPSSKAVLSRIALQGLDELLQSLGITYTDDQAREIGTRYRVGIAPSLRTPRSVKRYLNAIAFALPLLKGEASLADVIAVEGFHVAHPTVYRALREHPDLFLNPQPTFSLGRDDQADRAASRARLEEWLPPQQPDHDAALALARRVFPQVDALWGNSGRPRESAEWYAQQRMASIAYYDRYLAYALPTDEIPDQEIDAYLAEPASLAPALVELLRRRGAPAVGSLTQKLEVRIDRLTDAARAVLLAVLPALGSAVLDNSVAPSGLFERSLQERLANTIVRLIARSGTNERQVLAKQVLSTAEPLTFALECLRSMHARVSEAVGPIFGERTLDQLNRHLASRIVEDLDPNEPLWSREPRWATLIVVAAETAHAPSVRRTIGAWLTAEPTGVDTLLTGLAGKARNLGTGYEIQQDFST
jgi:predicted KAP-like P-loop ATPase